MSFFRSLFGKSSRSDEPEAAKPAREIEHKGFTIRAEPYKAEGGQFQTAGTVLKTVDGVVKEHKFVRADRHPTLEDATEFSLRKGRQMIDEQGERIFR